MHKAHHDQQAVVNIPQQPINGQPSGLIKNKNKFNAKFIFTAFGGLILIAVGFFIGIAMWFNFQISAVNSSDKTTIRIEVVKDSNPTQIGQLLKSESLIKSTTAFDWYIRLFINSGSLKAGIYQLSPSSSVPEIVKQLTKGSVEQIQITFFPGSTLVDNTKNTSKYDVTTILKKLGYSEANISAALSKKYTGKLFVSKPAGADLEGYIYGETYNFSAGASVEDILTSVFTEFDRVVSVNDFADSFSAHGLTLYQGITLASIIQREANTAADQKQVAQVFYKRLQLGMPLGSDVTYQYIADKTGVARDPNLDSPYNTRRFTGLPPGPISNPGLTALQAVANPASGDYLYFLSGDDDVTYFAKTLNEHESNIAKHCKVKCSAL